MIKIESSTEYHLVNPNNIRYISVTPAVDNGFYLDIHYIDGFALVIRFDNREAALHAADTIIPEYTPNMSLYRWTD